MSVGELLWRFRHAPSLQPRSGQQLALGRLERLLVAVVVKNRTSDFQASTKMNELLDGLVDAGVGRGVVKEVAMGVIREAPEVFNIQNTEKVETYVRLSDQVWNLVVQALNETEDLSENPYLNG